ncbi:MAG: hypothetical protein D6812_15105 [Deltaproteobacteria bacterium]|nr:MAG: hypothetical protein D6812_15105 [Deltaproteobacteria bacterium]
MSTCKPEYEIVYCREDTIAATYLRCDPDNGIVPVPPSEEPKWLRWLKLKSSKAKLGLVHHKRSGSFVLGYWHLPPSRFRVGVLQELETIPPERVNDIWPFPPSITPERLLNRLQPVDQWLEKMVREKALLKDRERIWQEEEAAERKDLAAYLRKKNKPMTARLVEDYSLPHMSKREMEDRDLDPVIS